MRQHGGGFVVLFCTSTKGQYKFYLYLMHICHSHLLGFVLTLVLVVHTSCNPVAVDVDSRGMCTGCR